MSARPLHSVWVRIVHACPDAPALEILAGSHLLTKMLAYGDSTPYMRLPAGEVNLLIRLPNHPHRELFSGVRTFNQHPVWTLVITGCGIRIALLVLQDILEPPPRNRASIRPILLVQGMEEATLKIDGQAAQATLHNGLVPGYSAIRPGLCTLSLNDEPRQWLEGELDLDGGANWTILIMGRKTGVPAPRFLALADSAWVLNSLR